MVGFCNVEVHARIAPTDAGGSLIPFKRNARVIHNGRTIVGMQDDQLDLKYGKPRGCYAMESVSEVVSAIRTSKIVSSKTTGGQVGWLARRQQLLRV